MKLNGKIVWITGSSSGIGKAAAFQFAEKGARVVVSARSVDKIDEIVGEINANGDSALAIPCDVTKNSQVVALVAGVKKTWGDIDILVNNAGVGTFKNILDLEENEWDEMMEINIKSAFLCSKAVLPSMIENKSGHIINIGSVAAKQPFENSGGYCASKYGMLGFTEVLRLENRKHGIKVSAVHPGATSTPIWGGSDVDHRLMMSAVDVAKSILSLCELDESTMVEEIVLRPQGGDL